MVDQQSLHDAMRLAVLDALRSEEVRLVLTAVSTTAAKTALRDELLKVGIDTEKPAQLHSDLTALRSWVSMWKSARGAIVKSVAGSLALGLIALVVLGAQDWILKLVKLKN